MTKTGTVKRFDESTACGFIAPDVCGKDLLAHASEIKDSDRKSLAESELVQFVVTQGQKGPQVSNIRLA